MAFSSKNPVAIVIDAETVSVADAAGAVAALAEKFPPLILHAFGDFRLPELQGWCELLDEFGGQALQVTPTEGHDNSVAICLAMNVMEILHAGSASAICIFCGDGDFSQLAVRVRKSGLPVFGFGTSESGATMAPWFDSWQDIDTDFGEEEALDTAEDEMDQPSEADAAAGVEPEANGVAEPEPDADRLAGFRPIYSTHVEFAGEINGSAGLDRVTKADIDAAMQSAQAHREAAGVKAPDDSELSADIDDNLDDIDVMAAIEGKPDCKLAKIRNAPPLSDENISGRLTDDATLLLSNFISDNLNGDGYALLSEVANAASATDFLVPPENKSNADEYLKQLLANDGRFEITTLPMGDIEPEFIRRI